MHENNQIFEEAFRETEEGTVEGNKKKVRVKLRDLILVGSKGKGTFSRFEPRKFGALGYEEVFQNIALETIGKEALKLRYYIGDHREGDIDNT